MKCVLLMFNTHYMSVSN